MAVCPLCSRPVPVCLGFGAAAVITELGVCLHDVKTPRGQPRGRPRRSAHARRRHPAFRERGAGRRNASVSDLHERDELVTGRTRWKMTQVKDWVGQGLTPRRSRDELLSCPRDCGSVRLGIHRALRRPRRPRSSAGHAQGRENARRRGRSSCQKPHPTLRPQSPSTPLPDGTFFFLFFLNGTFF